MISPNILLYGIVLPVLIAVSVFLFAWRPWRCHGQISRAELSGPIAIGLAYLIGHSGLRGFPSFPPVESVQWLFFLTIIIIILGIVETLFKSNKILRWGIRLFVSFTAPWVLLRSMFQYNWSKAEGIAWLAVIGILILIFWKILDLMTEAFTGYPSPLMTLIIATGTSTSLIISGSALLGHLGGLLCAALGSAFVISLFVPTFSLAFGATSVLAVILSGLLLNGYFYSELPFISIIPIFVTPIVPGIVKRTRVKQRGIFWINLVSAMLTAILAGISIGFAIHSSPPLDYGY